MGFFERQRTPTKAPPIRHVVFDVEGLLLDPTPGVRASLDATAREFGVAGGRPLPADWTPRCSLFATLSTLLGSEDCALIEAAYAGYHRHYADIGRRRFVRRPGAAALLDVMGVASGCQWHYLSTLGRVPSCKLLQGHGLDEAVRSVFSSEQPSCPGLRPQLLTALFGLIDTDPAAVAVLADLPADLYAAQSLGMTAISLDYGRCPPDVLHRAPAAHRLESVDAVRRWLQPRIALHPLRAHVDLSPSPAPRAARLH